MHLAENIREGIKSIKSNLLRTVLTALIVAIGILALVGTLTAVEGIKVEVNESLSGLGANSFSITNIRRRGRSAGKTQKVYPQIKYKELQKFKEVYRYPATVGISSTVTFSAEVKRLSEKTNPNIRIYAGDLNYLMLEDLNLEKGRNFSELEIRSGAQVAIIGSNIVKTLFKNDDPIKKNISFGGRKFRIIGVLERQGEKGNDSGGDRQIIIPIETGNAMGSQRSLRYNLKAAIKNSEEMNFAIGEATGLMRAIRKDPLGQDNSFEIAKNDSLAETLAEIFGYLTAGAFGVGFFTLLGASIGLMNIMMVSVTERTREIGIRKALGATPAKIREQFLIEAIVICIMGGLAGVLLGIAVGNLVSVFIGDGAFVIPWLWIIVGLVVCVLVGLGSGYFPASKASRLDPIDSLRFE